MTDLVFPDQQGYADLATLVRRARQADPDAAVRLQVTGAVLRVWVGVLPGTGLLAAEPLSASGASSWRMRMQAVPRQRPARSTSSVPRPR